MGRPEFRTGATFFRVFTAEKCSPLFCADFLGAIHGIDSNPFMSYLAARVSVFVSKHRRLEKSPNSAPFLAWGNDIDT